MVFGKKRQLNVEINPIFYSYPENQRSYQKEESQEFLNRDLTLCLERLCADHMQNKQKNIQFLKKLKKKLTSDKKHFTFYKT